MSSRKLKSAAIIAVFLVSSGLPACSLLPKVATGGTAPLDETGSVTGDALERGDYRLALDLGREALLKKPGNEALTDEYLRTIEGINSAGDDAFDRGDFESSAGAYRALLESFADFEPFAPRLSFGRKSLEEKLKSCRTASDDRQFRRSWESGDYPGALGIRLGSLLDFPGDADIMTAYVKTVRDIKAAGDKAREEKDFGSAGRIHSLLLRNYQTFKGLRPQVGFSRDELEDSISACRTALRNRGLAEYRKGNLTEAIAVWKSLLAFDPDNVEIRKAVETAKSQADKIKKKK